MAVKGSDSRQTRRDRLEAREDVILSAAYEEFLTQGLDGTRMTSIARRAGLAEGTLYLYFKNKNALVAAVVGRFYDRLTEGANQGLQTCHTTAERLVYLIRHHLVSCITEWPVLELAVPVYWKFREYKDSEFIGFNRTYAAILDQVVRDGLSRGELRKDVPIHIMRDLFFGTLEHSIRTYLIHNQDKDDTPAMNRAMDKLADHIASLILPAFGLNIEDQIREPSDLEGITLRLEAVADRLSNQT